MLQLRGQDKQTGRQTDRQTRRQAGRQTDKRNARPKPRTTKVVVRQAKKRAAQPKTRVTVEDAFAARGRYEVAWVYQGAGVYRQIGRWEG